MLKTQLRNGSLAKHKTIVFDTLQSQQLKHRKNKVQKSTSKGRKIFKQANIAVRIGEGALEEIGHSTKNLPKVEEEAGVTLLSKKSVKAIVANITGKNMDVEEARSYKYKYLKEKLDKKRQEESQITRDKANLLFQISQLRTTISELKGADRKYADIILNNESPEKSTKLRKKSSNIDLGISQIKAKGLHSIRVYEEQKNQLRKELDEKTQLLGELYTKIENIKCEIAKLREEQYDHYQTLLEKGLDTRHDGLIWIIKAIWNLGKNVNISKLPAYLDDKAIEFLFAVKNK